MKLRYAIPVFALVLASACAIAGGDGSGTELSPVPSCSKWEKQTDGSYWRTCVDDKGVQYCEVSKDNKVSKVKCK